MIITETKSAASKAGHKPCLSGCAAGALEGHVSASGPCPWGAEQGQLAGLQRLH